MHTDLWNYCLHLYARPGVEVQLWGLDMTVGDPFGNRLTFTQALNAA